MLFRHREAWTHDCLQLPNIISRQTNVPVCGVVLTWTPRVERRVFQNVSCITFIYRKQARMCDQFLARFIVQLFLYEPSCNGHLHVISPGNDIHVYMYMYEYLVNTQRHLSNLSYRKQFDRLHRLRYYWPNIDGFCNYSIKHQVSQLLVDVRFSIIFRFFIILIRVMVLRHLNAFLLNFVHQ